MNYELLLAGVTGAVAALGYAAGALAVRAAARTPEALPPRRALVLRALPGALALALGLGLALPAFLRFEPADTSAWPGGITLVLAVAGWLVLLCGLWQGLAAWWATRRVARDWSGRAEPLALGDASLPAFALDHAFPVVAVVGIARPRLFLARQVIAGLTPSEIQAVLAHEKGHLESRDNLKRLLVRCLPTIGWRAVGRRLDERWEAEAEAAADRRAGADAALELASALVKVARLAPPGARLGHAVAAFHTGDSIASRVNALVGPSTPDPAVPGVGRAAVLLLAALAGLAGAMALPLMHHLNEALVHLP